jgi:long-chain fatty acid transport protein
MKLNRFLTTALGTFAAILCQSSEAEALAASVKTFGMAGTGVAYAQDALAVAYNPAGMAWVGDRLDLGIHWAHDSGKTKIHGNLLPTTNDTYHAYKTKNFYSPEFGVNKTFGCECEWSVGLAVYNRQQGKTTYNKPFGLIGTSNLGLEYVHETISPVVAYRLNDCHSFGITLNCMVQRLKVNGIQKFDNAIFSSHPGHVTNKGYDWSVGFGTTLGWQWKVFDGFTLGLTYQPKTSMPRFNKYKGFLAQKGKFDIPQVFSGGISWRFVDCATICFDVQYYDWAQIKALHNKLAGGLAELAQDKLGTSKGTGFGWKSQTFYRVGLDFAATEDLILRVGYRHVNANTKKSQTVVNQLILDIVDDYATCGATYRINCDQEVSAYFAYGFKNKIKGNGSIPASFGGGESDIEAQKFALGLGWGMNF